MEFWLCCMDLSSYPSGNEHLLVSQHSMNHTWEYYRLPKKRLHGRWARKGILDVFFEMCQLNHTQYKSSLNTTVISNENKFINFRNPTLIHSRQFGWGCQRFHARSLNCCTSCLDPLQSIQNTWSLKNDLLRVWWPRSNHWLNSKCYCSSLTTWNTLAISVIDVYCSAS